MAYKRIDTMEHNRYTIAVCETLKKTFSFTAYLKKGDTGGKICHFEYDNKEYGYEQIKHELDAIDTQQTLRRKNGIPTTDEFVSVLRYIMSKDNVSEKKLDMLKFHAQAPNRIATAEELAKSVGYDDFNPANHVYGNLAKEICIFLNYKPANPKYYYKDGTQVWTFVIADNADDNPETKNDDIKNWRWVLREEVYEAMKICALI